MTMTQTRATRRGMMRPRLRPLDTPLWTPSPRLSPRRRPRLRPRRTPRLSLAVPPPTGPINEPLRGPRSRRTGAPTQLPGLASLPRGQISSCGTDRNRRVHGGGRGRHGDRRARSDRDRHIHSGCGPEPDRREHPPPGLSWDIAKLRPTCGSGRGSRHLRRGPPPHGPWWPQHPAGPDGGGESCCRSRPGSCLPRPPAPGARSDPQQPDSFVVPHGVGTAHAHLSDTRYRQHPGSTHLILEHVSRCDAPHPPLALIRPYRPPSRGHRRYT